MKEKMLEFMMYIGENQWGDCPTRPNSNGLAFSPKLQCDKKVWREVAREAVKYGFNTVFIPTVDGVKYKSHPEIAVEGAWEVEELKEELAYLRVENAVLKKFQEMDEKEERQRQKSK